MANRDYVARRKTSGKKNKKKGNKTILITLAMVVIIVFAVGLYFMKQQSNSNQVIKIEPKTEVSKPKSVLPNRPEEVWSYIKALETRTVPVDDSPDSLNQNLRLTDEQRKILIEMEKEQKAQATKLAEQNQAKQQAKIVSAQAVSGENVANKGKTETVEKATQNALPPKKIENAPQKKFGLQCGAFKNQAQAENLQARLIMMGLSAKVNQSADWNRVVVGPFDDRNGAVKAQQNASSISSCVIIGM